MVNLQSNAKVLRKEMRKEFRAMIATAQRLQRRKEIKLSAKNVH